LLAVLPYMREVAGSTPGLDFYLLCEPIYVSLRLFLNQFGTINNGFLAIIQFNQRSDWLSAPLTNAYPKLYAHRSKTGEIHISIAASHSGRIVTHFTCDAIKLGSIAGTKSQISEPLPLEGRGSCLALKRRQRFRSNGSADSMSAWMCGGSGTAGSRLWSLVRKGLKERLIEKNIKKLRTLIFYLWDVY
jgi:hypothetical protein